MDLFKSSLDAISLVFSGILMLVSGLLMFSIVGSVFIIFFLYLNPKAREFKRYFGLYPDVRCGPIKANEILRKKFLEIFSEEANFEIMADLEGPNEFLEEGVGNDLQDEWETIQYMAQLAEENSYPLDEQNKKYLSQINKRIKIFVVPTAA